LTPTTKGGIYRLFFLCKKARLHNHYFYEVNMLKSLLKPSSIAVIGASRTPGKVGYEIVYNLKHGGFKGAIVPVNPSATDIIGIPCYSDLATYGKKIDLSIIVVPAAMAIAATEQSIAAGAKALIVITAGFKEVGKEGAALEKELAALCAANGVRLVGPNCLGVLNTFNNMNASFATRMPKPGPIAVISQSGALLCAILDEACEQKLGLSLQISMGNKADLNETDFCQALAEDANTKVIMAYLESVVNGQDFIRVATEISKKKPIVLFKSGVTQAGSRAASSHTGSLAGADTAYQVALHRAGIIRTFSYDAFFDYAAAFAMQPLPQGDRIAIITNAGGPGIMAADAVELSGMKMATLTPALADALRAKLPPAASVANPVDVLGDANAERYSQALQTVLKDDAVDAVIVLLTPQSMTRPKDTAEAIRNAAKTTTKPILTAFMGGLDIKEGKEMLSQEFNIPCYSSAERCAAAMKAMCDYAQWRKTHQADVPSRSFKVDQKAVRQIIDQHLANGRKQMGEAAAKQIFRAYGIPVAPGQLCTSADEAATASAKIDFPCVMKIASPDIIHKSDIGGVKLNLNSAAEVKAAFTAMMDTIRTKAPNARIDGVYLEKMCERGREVIIGMTRDPQFGPMIMFGLGGIFVEVMKDVSFEVTPIREVEANAMMERTRSFPLLKGVRGQAGVDLALLSETLQRLSLLVCDFPQIKELDINPFIANEAGKPSFAADGRMTLSE
jgi:acetyltransferase